MQSASKEPQARLRPSQTPLTCTPPTVTDGGEVVYLFTQGDATYELRLNLASTPQKQSTKITIGGQMYTYTESSGPDGKLLVHKRFGATFFGGAHEIDLAIKDGTVTGTIDGQPIAAESLSALAAGQLALASGAPLPVWGDTPSADATAAALWQFEQPCLSTPLWQPPTPPPSTPACTLYTIGECGIGRINCFEQIPFCPFPPTNQCVLADAKDMGICIQKYDSCLTYDRGTFTDGQCCDPSYEINGVPSCCDGSECQAPPVSSISSQCLYGSFHPFGGHCCIPNESECGSPMSGKPYTNCTCASDADCCTFLGQSQSCDQTTHTCVVASGGSCTGNNQCEPGQACVGGVCVCDATSCPNGCCNGGAMGTCEPYTSQSSGSCGTVGAACVACSTTTADACMNGACTCGSGPACAAGQRCVSGVCVCDATSCPNGCCTSSGACQAPSLAACGSGAAACVACNSTTADSCTNGVCTCGLGAACAAGQQCVGGQCVCNATSCPTGCCNGNVCTTTSASACGTAGSACATCPAGDTCVNGACETCAQTCTSGCCSGFACEPSSFNTCGTGGAACAACNTLTADSCTNGQCTCGTGPACAPGQQCVGGACVCNATSCPNGCCDSSNTCQSPSLSTCGAGGAACVACTATADSCTAGACTCGTGSACTAGNVCESGSCMACTGVGGTPPNCNGADCCPGLEFDTVTCICGSATGSTCTSNSQCATNDCSNGTCACVAAEFFCSPYCFNAPGGPSNDQECCPGLWCCPDGCVNGGWICGSTQSSPNCFQQ